MEITGALREENIEARSLRDPEAGQGIRYYFRKDVRLKAGTHKVIITIPEDQVAMERELNLKDGSVNDLALEPVYGFMEVKKLPPPYTQTGFLEGIKGFRMILNGKPL